MANPRMRVVNKLGRKVLIHQMLDVVVITQPPYAKLWRLQHGRHLKVPIIKIK